MHVLKLNQSWETTFIINEPQSLLVVLYLVRSMYVSFRITSKLKNLIMVSGKCTIMHVLDMFLQQEKVL